MGGLLREFWLFLRQEKKWWLVPMLVVLGLVGILVVVAHLYPGFAPFIYPIV
jgi:competence protein ComGC